MGKRIIQSCLAPVCIPCGKFAKPELHLARWTCPCCLRTLDHIEVHKAFQQDHPQQAAQ
jgi:hypothetical protein